MKVRVIFTVGLLTAACATCASPAIRGDEPDHAAALRQKAERPSLPDFPYAKGYEAGVTHFLKGNGVFWSVLAERRYADKRDTEGDIAVLPDGSLLVAWSDFFTERWDDDAPSRIAMRRSRDGGRTWSRAEVLQPQMGTNTMSVSLLRTGKGTVLLAFLCKNGPDGPCVPYIRRSTDDGKTFGPPILASAGGRNRAANSDRLLEVRDPSGKHGDRGRILLTCKDWPARAGVVVYSDDDGITWRHGKNVPVRSDWGSQNFNEPGIVELADGRLWMYGRTTMGFHAQAWSTDRGMTWSRPEPTVLRGPCSPLTGETIPETEYTKEKGWAGDILFTFPNHGFDRFPRRYRYTARTPLDSALSRDGARTWECVRTIEEDPTVQYGYTSITFVPEERSGMRVLLTTHVEPIPTAAHRPHILKYLSIPLSWFYEKASTPRRGIDFGDEENHTLWDPSFISDKSDSEKEPAS